MKLQGDARRWWERWRLAAVVFALALGLGAFGAIVLPRLGAEAPPTASQELLLSLRELDDGHDSCSEREDRKARI